MLTVQFLKQRVVCGFGEVTLLIQQSQQTQFLWKQQVNYQPETRRGSEQDASLTFSIRSKHSPLSIQWMSTQTKPSLQSRRSVMATGLEPAGQEPAGRDVSDLHLLVVLELLQGENVLVEIFLQLLVGVVDVELLEAVHLWSKGQV